MSLGNRYEEINRDIRAVSWRLSYLLCLGSVKSPKASPIILNENATRKIVRPGKITSQGALKTFCMPCDTRVPSSGNCGLGENPKNIRLENVRITPPMS